MSGDEEEHAHAPPQAVASWNEGGHPVAWEMIAGTLLMWVGLSVLLVWVATFDDIWAIGILPLALGAILLFHANPILKSDAPAGHDSHHA